VNSQANGEEEKGIEVGEVITQKIQGINKMMNALINSLEHR
jgi:hypothetical protein